MTMTSPLLRDCDGAKRVCLGTMTLYQHCTIVRVQSLQEEERRGAVCVCVRAGELHCCSYSVLCHDDDVVTSIRPDADALCVVCYGVLIAVGARQSRPEL